MPCLLENQRGAKDDQAAAQRGKQHGKHCTDRHGAEIKHFGVEAVGKIG